MNTGNKIRILIADDHELVREGLKARLSMSEMMEICGEANSGSEAIRLDRELEPDITFLDISMPGMTGLEAAANILAQSPNRKIIFLSIYDNPEYVSEALRVGAKGYLLKDVSREEMTTAVQAVYNGGTYLGSKINQTFQEAGKPVKSHSCQYNLSDRERQVLAEIAKGSKNKTIAEKLNISVRTVESHRLTLREKTGGGNAAELFRIASKLGLA
ncbi:MAG: response regulator transcription factor [Pseudomonadota bacterium]